MALMYVMSVFTACETETVVGRARVFSFHPYAGAMLACTYSQCQHSERSLNAR